MRKFYAHSNQLGEICFNKTIPFFSMNWQNWSSDTYVIRITKVRKSKRMKKK